MSEFQPYIGKEINFQKTAARILDSITINGEHILWFHPANERDNKVKVSKTGAMYSPAGNMFKQMGVKSGVLDCIVLEARHRFAGLAIELKVGANKMTDNQKMWFKKLMDRGWSCHCTNSLDEFTDIVETYFDSTRNT